MKSYAVWVVLLMVAGLVGGQARDTRPLIRPRAEVIGPEGVEEDGPDGTNFLTVHTFRRNEIGETETTDGDERRAGGQGRGEGRGRGRGRGGGDRGGGRGGGGEEAPSLEGSSTSGVVELPDVPVFQPGPSMSDAEISRRQMDTIILLLQRLSDRQSAFETLQSQRSERIDNINYRLTRMELLAEERKGVLNEISNSIRHRMETTDGEMDRITTIMDNVKEGIAQLSQRHVDLRALITDLPRTDDDAGNNGPKLQAVAASVFGVRMVTQAIQHEIAELGQNFTQLTNITNAMSHMRDNMVSKQYLLQSLTDLKARNSAPVLAPMPRMMTSRGRQGTKEPEDCWQLLRQGKKTSGVYRIQPQFSSIPFFVYCDMETDGGGWTVIQRREDGTVDFLREWNEYKHGFGNLAGEFWLGNEKIHLLTSQYVSKLRVDLSDFDQQSSFAVYSAFAIGSEQEGYSLKMLGEYRGDAGDSMRYHVGRRFSTIDVDNDAWPDKNCARDHTGAWWYRACSTSNLNGRYLHGPIPMDHEYNGLYWYDFRGPLYSLWRSRLMIRRGGNVGRPVFKDIDEIKSSTTTPRPEEPPQQERHERTTEMPDYFNPEHDPYATYDYQPYG